jgi:hypothetical protein
MAPAPAIASAPLPPPLRKRSQESINAFAAAPSVQPQDGKKK